MTKQISGELYAALLLLQDAADNDRECSIAMGAVLVALEHTPLNRVDQP